MASERLTDKRIAAIKPPTSGRTEIWDAAEKGLILRVSPNGRKAFAVQYKINEFDRSGYRKTRKLTLGEYGPHPPAMTLKEARRLARAAKAAVDGGEDPAQIKIDENENRKETARRKNALTVSEAIEAFAAESVDSPSKWKRHERPRILRSEVVTRFGRRGVGELTHENLAAIQSAIAGRGAKFAANRFAEATRAFFRWAVDRYGIANPSIRLSRITDEEELARDRFLSPAELNKVWSATVELTPLSRDFVRVLMLTPQRVSAVTGMRFDQVASDGIWLIPKGQKKQKVTAQALPLADRAREIIAARTTNVTDPSCLVFSSGRAGDRRLQATSKIKARLDRVLRDQLDPWRFHDLRRSFSTWAAANGIDQVVVRKILDHGQGHRDKLDAIYNRFSYVDEQRAALNSYAEAFADDR